MHKKGFVLTNAALEMEHDYSFFCAGLEFLRNYDIDTVEFFTDSKNAARYGKAVQDAGMEPLFLTAIAQKRSGFCRLCAEDENERRTSVEFTKNSLCDARNAGAARVIIQSGAYPKDPSREGEAMDALCRSLHELSEYAGTDLVMHLEPCDRALDVRQLIGPTMQTYTLMKRLELPYENVRLTMDVAHIAELFEDPISAISLCKEYSSHVHLANCVLKSGAPLFGDKHPPFGYPDSCYTVAAAELVYEAIKKIYKDEELLISMEMIHSGTISLNYIQMLFDAVPWLYKQK